MQPGTRPDPSVLVIFGAAGDLTGRKLVPALYNLSLDGWLPERFAVLGVDLRQLSGDDELRGLLRQGVDQHSRRGPADPQAWEAFASHLHYLSGDFHDPAVYAALAQQLRRIDAEWQAQPSHLFYLAVPPGLIGDIVQGLGQAGLAKDGERARIVVEKPFGYDLCSATALNRLLTGVFAESQIYRIDHYLGKETVQNILAFRFANGLFEPTWDRRYIDHVQITVAEQVGVEHRGGYYEHAGALRDMVQNHLLQVLCLVAMEPPVSFCADEIRNKKLDVLCAIRPFAAAEIGGCTVRGQYGPGEICGQKVPGYREEPDVAADSQTETFVALKLFVDNWRWQDVPFYLRTGKRLMRRGSEVCIQFRPVPHRSFPAAAVARWQPNRLLIRIQPEEGIVLRFQAKEPGPTLSLLPVDMRFTYSEAFRAPPPEAYETLLHDVMMGDATLFMRADQVQAAWTVVDPILAAWQALSPGDFPNYAAGTFGPAAADELMRRDGRSWTLSAEISPIASP